MRSIALLTIALVGLAAPALAQDRTPPASDLRVYAPPIDWSASELQAPVRSDDQARFTGRSAATVVRPGPSHEIR